MNHETLYWETGIRGRTPYRKYFLGWRRAYKNALWWAKARYDTYIGVYGCKSIREDGLVMGYRRKVLPNYETVHVDKIFLDLDWKNEEYNQDALEIAEYLEAEDIRRRWSMSGAGFHCLIRAKGSTKNVDNGIFYFIKRVCKGKMVDPGAFDVERMRRLPGSFNRRRGCYCIPIREDQLSIGRKELRLLASNPKPFGTTFPVGTGTFYLDEIPDSRPHETVKLGRYDRHVLSVEKHKILEEYGLDWDIDFCPAMQYLITKKEVGNFERLQILKYLRSVLKVPFVDVLDKKKTVMNLMFNLLEDKKKARHSISMHEAQCVYKRKRKFHPHKLRLLQLCPPGCADCLDRRNEI